MSNPETPATPAAGPALGRIPSGIFIVTARNGASSAGLLASWLQQAGFDPPAITLAVARDREIAALIHKTGRLVVNQLSDGQHRLMRHFARPSLNADDPFAGIDTLDPQTAQGGPVLAEALSYLDVVVAGTLDGGDHRIILGTVVGGAVLRDDAKPMVHLRRNGLHY